MSSIPFGNEIDDQMYNIAFSADIGLTDSYFGLNSTIDPNLNIRSTEFHKANVHYDSLYLPQNAEIWDDSLSKCKKKYICLFCYRAFENPCSRKQHIEVMHIQEYKYICRHCEVSFTDDAEYNGHVNMHKNMMYYKCQACEKTFYTPKEMSYHLREHFVDITFRCAVCSKIFHDKLLYEAHCKDHNNDENNNSRVEHEIEKLQAVTTASLLHLEENKLATYEQQPNPQKIKLLTKEYIYPCTVCPQKFDCKLTYDRHYVEQHQITKKKKSIDKSEPESLACTTCGLLLTIGEEQNNHECQEIKTNKLKYYCHICGKGFNHAGSVKRHIKTHEHESDVSATGKSRCPICQKVYRKETSMRYYKNIVIKLNHLIKLSYYAFFLTKN